MEPERDSSLDIVLDINSLENIARQGDHAAEEKLFQHLSESFQLFVRQKIWSKQDSEEIVQEALATIAQKHKSVGFETSFAAWAYRVLQNKINDYYRAKRRRESRFEYSLETGSSAGTWNPDPELKRRLLDCLKQVSLANIRHAEILHLHYIGYAIVDICETLGLTRNAAYILLSRARTMLKSCLEKGMVEP